MSNRDARNNIDLKYSFFFITLCCLVNIYFNYYLKLSGDENTYYNLALESGAENQLFLPGFTAYLSILTKIFFITNFATLKIIVTLINFSLLIFITYSLYKFTKFKYYLIIVLISLSPTYFYFLSSLWPDTFSALLFCSSIMLVPWINFKKSLIIFIIFIFILMLLTILRPQYSFFISLISFYFFINIFNKNDNFKISILNKILIWFFSNILIFSPLIIISYKNFIDYGAFLPLISPLIAELYHFPSPEFKELASKLGNLTFYDCETFIAEFASSNNINFYEASNLLTNKYSLKSNSDFFNVSISNIYIFFWEQKYSFLERYSLLFCWGNDECILRDNFIIFKILELFLRTIFILISVILIFWPLLFKVDMRIYIFFLLIYIIFISLHCLGGNPTHGRYVYQFYPIVFLFLNLFLECKSKDRSKIFILE